MKNVWIGNGVIALFIFTASVEAAPAPLHLSTVLQSTIALTIIASPTLPQLQYQLWATPDLSVPFAPIEVILEASGPSVSWTVPIEMPAGAQGLNALLAAPTIAGAEGGTLTQQF